MPGSIRIRSIADPLHATFVYTGGSIVFKLIFGMIAALLLHAQNFCPQPADRAGIAAVDYPPRLLGHFLAFEFYPLFGG